ncbi:hypothetical protein [Nosocomiicoccus sp. HMSC059G07]|uniref:hypothetical protein n=1 Tax=Nosocomiicoccus sp. HMSC059G07 TaxID=1739531 RepID=UPI0008A36BD7|nr:hypothetical protein [Nosocomiicoccus sp. HMSC059G07]OFO55311.1 hypothetical protein HMPREF3029_04640 [Nosocomiicoccus sp. HMSC059G07]
MNLKKKDIDSIVQSVGLNPKEWREDVLSHARLSIMDKQGEIYKEFEQNVIEKEALKLLIDQTRKTNSKAIPGEKASPSKNTKALGEMKKERL